MSTPRVAAVLLLLLLSWAPDMAAAQSAAERAAQLNDEGKVLWQDENDLAGAAEKFRQATVLSPEGRYYFNLCYCLHQLGRYREALTACRAVEPNGADEKVLEKTAIVLEDLEKRVPAGDPADGTGTPDDTGYDDGTGTPDDTGYDDGTGAPDDTGYDDGTGAPDGTGYDDGTGAPYPPPDGPPGYQGQPSGPPAPLAGLEKATGPTDEYNWSLGAELGFLGASIGRDGYYGGSGANIKAHASFMLMPRRQIGVQGYLSVAQVGSSTETGSGEGVGIVDAGAALFKHIRRQRFYLTPLVGLHLTNIQPDSQLEPLVSAGLRAELALSIILGPQRNHVFSVTPALSVYLPASGPDVGIYGLDEGSAAMALNIGYTLRFMTPFGQSPIIILE